MKLYLHIGTEKTGTTSIQRFFRANRDLLRKNGVLYPSAPGEQNHMGLTIAAQKEKKLGPLRQLFRLHSSEDVHRFREDLLRKLSGELEGGDFKSVIMSGEHCSSRLLSDIEVARLRDMLSGFFDDIRIIIYIRRQDEYLLSTYSTTIKSGSTRALHFPGEKSIEHRYDYWDLLSRWQRNFGRERIVCRKFEKQSLKQGNVIDDFLDTVQIDSALPLARPEKVNESLDAESLEFLRLFNGYIPRFTENGVNELRNNLVPLLSKLSSGPLPTLPEHELVRFMNLFTETNRRVAVEYFGGIRNGGGDPLFEPSADDRPRLSNASLTSERAVEIAASLWHEKQVQLNRVSQRAEKLREKVSRQRGRGLRLHRGDVSTLSREAGAEGVPGNYHDVEFDKEISFHCESENRVHFD